MRVFQQRLSFSCHSCLCVHSQDIKGNVLIVRDTVAWDGVRDCIVASKLTKVPKEVAWNAAQWNAAWYLRDGTRWVTCGTKQWKTANVTTFDIRECFIEDAEYRLMDSTDPNWNVLVTLPLQGWWQC